ncbi:hypothetical protein NO559_15245 [Dasania sp. GY-MA-18]|uniref:Uncharacterized protein n=1 Tax=Dasania phycosphaerae TaxID=2950436 RepID=A0A9J6RRB7_9GAMM|nr:MULTISPECIES: hypothetical protein [Dasania]MCR8924139.1 hypothetical protein [Dasania sp. GY-MA-18]MCZ0866712.1 hypothetical protein [Dasania phycosphaerae]MCZ0870297.1 hypothetical protein [Dasania phycosphaerae]
MRFSTAATLSALICLFSLTAQAAKPTSITFESDKTSAEGDEYSVYVVVCSNHKSLKLSAWDKRKKWCLGEGQSEDCERKQIKAAKKACR